MSNDQNKQRNATRDAEESQAAQQQLYRAITNAIVFVEERNGTAVEQEAAWN